MKNEKKSHTQWDSGDVYSVPVFPEFCIIPTPLLSQAGEMDAGHCWLYSPLSGDEPSYNIHCTKRQQGTGTISYLKNKNNPDNAQSMDEKLCYILLVLPGLSLQPWE